MKNEGGAHGDGPCLNLQGITRLEMGFLIVLYQDLEPAAEKHAMSITGDSSRTLLQPSKDLQFHRFTKAVSYFPTSKKHMPTENKTKSFSNTIVTPQKSSKNSQPPRHLAPQR